jgi:hypothetical protein
MKERLDSHRLSNGMVILGEPMADVESASFYFWSPPEMPIILKAVPGRAKSSLTGCFAGQVPGTAAH